MGTGQHWVLNQSPKIMIISEFWHLELYQIKLHTIQNNAEVKMKDTDTVQSLTKIS